MTGDRSAGRVLLGVRDIEDPDALAAMLQAVGSLRPSRRRSLTVLHARPEREGWRTPGTAEQINADAALRRRLTETVRRVTDPAGWRVEIEVVSTTMPAEEALVLASRRAELLVLARRRLPRLHRVVRGFVTSTLAARASCPVLVVRPGETGGSDYVLAVADAATAGSVVPFAAREAAWRGVALVVVDGAAALAAPQRRNTQTADSAVPLTRDAQLLVIGCVHSRVSGDGSQRRETVRLLGGASCPVVVIPQAGIPSAGRVGHRERAVAPR